MNRREFIKTSAGAFFIASAGKVFGAAAPSHAEGGREVALSEITHGCDIMCGDLKGVVEWN